MASQIRRRKVGNATITQNLTTGDVTHSVQFGDKLVKNTISKKVSNDGKTRHRTTTTRNHGPGIWSRTTKTRTQGGKNDGALGRAIWNGLFGSTPKKKKPTPKPKSKPTPKPTPKPTHTIIESVMDKYIHKEVKVADGTTLDEHADGIVASLMWAFLALGIIGYFLFKIFQWIFITIRWM